MPSSPWPAEDVNRWYLPETTLGVEHLEYARQILLRNNPYGQNFRRRLPMLMLKDDYEAPNWDTEAMAQWRPGQPEQEVGTETVFLNEQGLHLVVHRARQGGFSQFLVDDPDFTV